VAQRRGRKQRWSVAVTAYRRRTRGTGADKMQWVGAPFIRAHHVRLMRSCGGHGTGQQLSTTAHGIHAHSGHSEAAAAWELREGHAKEVCPYAICREVSWTGGAHPGVHAEQQGALVHHAYPSTRVHRERYTGA
jgi:hypothetical protein